MFYKNIILPFPKTNHFPYLLRYGLVFGTLEKGSKNFLKSKNLLVSQKQQLEFPIKELKQARDNKVIPA